ncbi:MAG TPA: phosphatidylserine/phosphatidylglycerophosphate/cardiolipin synthase family protein [Sphingomicrobium sp.]|nr:phosphatidylserine/phosphatidylglycerophosphate/cardiolipin synthase family protein [Sphingomicrobium sp.]
MADQPPSWPRLLGGDQPIRARIAGTRLELVESGEARLQAILDLIDGAEHSVRLLFYIFVADRVGRRIRDALAAAAQRGVKVKLLLDGYGCSAADPAFFQEVARHGGKLCLFHPRYGRRYLVRNHQKLCIADERRALIGGANIEDCYMTDEGPRHWRDLFLALDGEAVPAAAAYFDALYRWTTRKDAKLKSLRRLVHRHSQFRGPLQWKFSGPLSARNPWRSGVGREIAHGRQLDLIAPYFWPPRSMLRRIGRLAMRGRARLITAAKSDNNATIAAARDTYSRLLRRGVEIYEYQPARLHTKLVIVDDAVHIGSANFDFRSLYINLEIMLRIEDPGFARQMRGYFDREIADSEHITAELHSKRANLWRRLKWRVSHWLVTSMDYTVTRRLNFGPDC